jgi:decaprenyl-phosphate phosphoribosyltransferase
MQTLPETATRTPLPPRRPTARVVDRKPAATVTATDVPTGARAWIVSARIRQWPKNLLVLAAPAAAGVLGRSPVLARVLLTLVVFCLLASGAYVLNDVRDAPEDRRHPVKRHRPIAAGAVSAHAARIAGAGALLLGLGAAILVSRPLFATACGYVALNFAYTRWLRRIAIADIAAIAGAFVLRAVAGGVAADVPISRWFIVVVSFAALFVAAGKRYADFIDPLSRRSRPVLDEYTADFLRLVLGVACAVALGAYCLWAFEASAANGVPWRSLTILPFTLALLRYGLLVSTGAGGAPEEILLGDRFIMLAGAAWLGMFVLGV